MKRDEYTWRVGDYGIRPISADTDTCTYCQKPRGDIHQTDCVIRRRTVVVRAIVEYTVKMPESWDEHDIEFHRNESSWCADNGIREIGDLLKRRDKRQCMCSDVKYEYVREATEEDEERDQIFVKEEPS